MSYFEINVELGVTDVKITKIYGCLNYDEN